MFLTQGKLLVLDRPPKKSFPLYSHAGDPFAAASQAKQLKLLEFYKHSSYPMHRLTSKCYIF